MKRAIQFMVFMLLLLFPTYAFAELSAPEMLKPEVGEGYIKWTWTEVQNAEGYVFSSRWEREPYFAPDLVETVLGQTYYIQQNLTINTSYSCSVYAFSGAMRSQPSQGYGNANYYPPSWWAEQIRIVDKYPGENAINVPVDQKINITFAPLLDTSTINLTNIVLKAGSEIFPTSLNYDPITGIVTITPVGTLRENTTYHVSVSNVKSTKNALTTSANWIFTTGQLATEPIITVAPIIVTETTPNTLYDYTDIENHWAKDSIQTLINKGVLPNNVTNFYPNQAINREDFVKLLITGMKYQPTTYTGKFTDVAPDSLYAPYIQTAFDKGIVQGTSLTTFSPTASITREEIATMLDRALKLENITPIELKQLTEFKDYQTISTWAVDSVKNIYSLGLIKGKTDVANVIFDPVSSTTNAENATLLVRLLSKLVN